MIAQGRNIDQVLSYILLQLKVEREERLRKMSRFMCLSYNVISDVCHTNTLPLLVGASRVLYMSQTETPKDYTIQSFP